MCAMQEKLNRMDLLLLLLLADGNKEENEPIEGKTRLQKQLFLAQKSLSEHKIEKPYSFRPYLYGPYCTDIYSDINLLEKEGVVKEEEIADPYCGIVRVFRLTTQGINEAKNLIKNDAIKEQYEIVRVVKKEYNCMSVVDLVDFTHKAFKDYAKNAIT